MPPGRCGTPWLLGSRFTLSPCTCHSDGSMSDGGGSAGLRGGGSALPRAGTVRAGSAQGVGLLVAAARPVLANCYGDS